MKLYVGNIDRDASEEELKEIFEGHGAIESLTIIKDRMTKESRGFGFVTFSSSEEAQNAMKAVNGQMLKGRALRVTEALAKEERPPRREGGFGGGGEGRSGGFGGGGRSEGRSGGFGGGGGGSGGYRSGGSSSGSRDGGPRRSSSPRFGN